VSVADLGLRRARWRCPDVTELVLGSGRTPAVAPRCGDGDRLRSPGSPDGPTACSPILSGFGPKVARAARSAFQYRRPACPGRNRTSVRSRHTANPAASPEGSTANPPAPCRLRPACGRGSTRRGREADRLVPGRCKSLRFGAAVRSGPWPSRRPMDRQPPELSRASARGSVRNGLPRSYDRQDPAGVAFGASASAAAFDDRPVVRMVFLLSRTGGGASVPLAARTARRRPACAGPGGASGFGWWQRQVLRSNCRWVRHPQAPTSRFACPEVLHGGTTRCVGSAGARDVAKSTHLERAGSEQRALPVSRGRFSSSVSKGKQSTSRRQRPPRGGRTPREEKALKGEPHGRYRHETRSEGVAGSKALRG
jgi:hypothetical protein